MGTGVKQHISDEGGSDEALGEMQLGELPHALQTTLAIFIKETFKCSLIFQRFHCSRSNKLRQSQAMQAEPKAVHGGEQHCCLLGSAAPTQQQCSPRKACTMLGCSCLAQSWWLCSAAGHVEQQAGMVHGDRALQGSQLLSASPGTSVLLRCWVGQCRVVPCPQLAEGEQTFLHALGLGDFYVAQSAVCANSTLLL